MAANLNELCVHRKLQLIGTWETAKFSLKKTWTFSLLLRKIYIIFYYDVLNSILRMYLRPGLGESKQISQVCQTPGMQTLYSIYIQTENSDSASR